MSIQDSEGDSDSFPRPNGAAGAIPPMTKVTGVLPQTPMKVRVSPTRYHYPDIVVGCTPGKNDDYTEENPCLLIEVLSQSTRMLDQNYKVERYQEIPSLQAYLMVDSLSHSAAIWRRSKTGWEYKEVEGSVELPCVNVTLSLEEVYEGLTF